MAAHLVGPTGKVFAVDVTPAMVEKTRINAKACGFEARVTAVEQEFEFPRLIGGSRNGADWPTIIARDSVDVVRHYPLSSHTVHPPSFPPRR